MRTGRLPFLPLLLATSIVGCLLGCWVGCSAGSDANAGLTPPVSGPLPDRFALQFDGINDYASSGTGGFPRMMFAQTLSLWVNTTLGGDPQTFIVLRKFLQDGVQLGVRGGKLSAWRSTDGAVLVDGPVLPQGAWHHVAYVYDGTSQHTLFLDAMQVATSAATPADTRLNIGAWLGTFDGVEQMFSGQMDAVHVWTAARSAADLAAEMAGKLPLPQDGLAAWWGFDEASGGLALDYSGHRNTCTLGDGDPARMPTRVPTTVPDAAAGTDAGTPLD